VPVGVAVGLSVAMGVAVGPPVAVGLPVGEIELIGVGWPWADRVGEGVPLGDGEGTEAGPAVGVADMDGAGTCPPGRAPCCAGCGENDG